MYKNSLCHYGVLGMKWGHRKQLAYANQVKNVKRKHSKERYQSEIDSNTNSISNMKKAGYKKWAKDNFLDDYKDSDQKKLFNEQIKYHEYKIKDAKNWMSTTDTLNKRLDGIDTSSMKYREAMKKVREIENDWINENINKFI